jgi:hypothetical protein
VPGKLVSLKQIRQIRIRIKQFASKYADDQSAGVADLAG